MNAFFANDLIGKIDLLGLNSYIVITGFYDCPRLCQDKCQDGTRNYTVDYKMGPGGQTPAQMNMPSQFLNNHGMMSALFGRVGSYLNGGMSQVVADQIADDLGLPGGSSVLSFYNWVIQMASMRTTGVATWTKVKWENCEDVRCLLFFRRKDWVPKESGWNLCTIGTVSQDPNNAFWYGRYSGPGEAIAKLAACMQAHKQSVRNTNNNAR